jgi:uncharacterized phiE125 gp8 family phage protein
MLNLSLITPPEQEPLEVEEVKSHLRITGTDEDAFIASIILPSARESVEVALNRALISQTWEWVFDGGFPGSGTLHFPKGSLQSVTHVKYTNTADVETTWADSNYTVETRGEFGRLWLKDGITWPDDVKLSTPGVAWIRFVAGYGDDGDDVPAGIRHLILLMCGQIYEHREPTVTGTTVMDIPLTWRYLVTQHMIRDFAHLPT